MEQNKWFWFVFLFCGAMMTGQAAHYFIGGDTYKSSALRDFLVVIQLLVGIAIVFYGWKRHRLLDKS